MESLGTQLVGQSSPLSRDHHQHLALDRHVNGALWLSVSPEERLLVLLPTGPLTGAPVRCSCIHDRNQKYSCNMDTMVCLCARRPGFLLTQVTAVCSVARKAVHVAELPQLTGSW